MSRLHDLSIRWHVWLETLPARLEALRDEEGSPAIEYAGAALAAAALVAALLHASRYVVAPAIQSALSNAAASLQ